MLPIFRSAAQARILTELFVGSDDPISLADIARRTGGSSGAVHREIERLESAGLVQSRRVGRTRLVEPNPDSPYHDNLRDLMVKAFGPATVLRRLLAGIDGVEEAFIFGSWARAMEGDWREQPHDIDLMIIGSPNIDQVNDRLRLAEAELGREVSAAIFTRQEWLAADSGFVGGVADGAKAEVLP